MSATVSNTLVAFDTTIDRNVASSACRSSVPLFWVELPVDITAARGRWNNNGAAEQTRQQAGLDFYSNYVALDNALSSLTTARVLFTSSGCRPAKPASRNARAQCRSAGRQCLPRRGTWSSRDGTVSRQD